MRRILLIGATGFVGQALGQELARQGYDLFLLSRGTKPQNLAFPCQMFPWGGNEQALPAAALDGVDAVINLAGESVAEGRWTAAKKTRLRTSRLGPTAALAAAIAVRANKPQVVIQASAVGYYGERGDQQVDEHSASGADFLAQLCVDWEQAAAPITKMGVRVAVLRLGTVLGLDGGALPKLAKLYHRGLGAAPGSGKQWFSWIHIGDLVQLFLMALRDSRATGPINAVAPVPCRYETVHGELSGRHRPPLLMRAPAPIMHLAMGEAAAIVLTSTRVDPAAAHALGFSWRYREIKEALDDLLGTGRLRPLDWLAASQWVSAPLAEVAAFFAAEHNLEQMTPPWLNFKVVSKSTPQIGDQTRIRYRLKLHGIPLHWESLIKDWQPGHSFVDEQLRGPYAIWHHRHSFEAVAGGTIVHDLVHYSLPAGKLGALAAGWYVDHDVGKIFAYRRQAVQNLLGPRPASAPSQES